MLFAQGPIVQMVADSVRVFDTVYITIVDSIHAAMADRLGANPAAGESTALASVFLTVGLLVFAGMQWWVTWKAEESRRIERDQDLADRQIASDRAADSAFQLVWSEHFRLDSLADRWAQEDLVVLAALGVLRGEALLPRDWPTVARSVSSLSQEAGFLGGIALTLAHDTENRVAELVAIVQWYRHQYPTDSPVEIAEKAYSNSQALISPLIVSIRSASRDLALLLWDAASHTPRASLVRTLDFQDDVKSKFGKHVIEKLTKRESSANSRKGTPPASEPS